MKEISLLERISLLILVGYFLFLFGFIELQVSDDLENWKKNAHLFDVFDYKYRRIHFVESDTFSEAF